MAVSHRRALNRERAVRQAGVSLVAAVTVDQAAAAVRSATDALLVERSPRDVLLAVRTDGTFHAATAASAYPEPMSKLGTMTEL